MRTLGIVLAGLVTLLTAGTASAEVYSGTLCNPHGVDVASLDYNQFGIFNISTTAKEVLCGGATSGPVQAISSVVYDRSPIENVTMTVFVINTSGGVLFTGAASTTGFASGSMPLSVPIPPLSGVMTAVLKFLLPANHPTNGVSVATTYTIVD